MGGALREKAQAREPEQARCGIGSPERSCTASASSRHSSSLTSTRDGFGSLFLPMYGSPRQRGGPNEKVPTSFEVFVLEASGGVGPLPILAQVNLNFLRQMCAPAVTVSGTPIHTSLLKRTATDVGC